LREGSDEIGVALGTYTAGLDSTVAYLRGLVKDGAGGVPALLFSNTVSNAPASLCAIEFGLRGPNVTFNQREASSLAALTFAVGAVRDGRVSAVLTGGVDRLEEVFFKVHDRFRALSPKRAGGEEATRPFDRRRNGFILGEGGFMLLIESASSATRRGAGTARSLASARPRRRPRSTPGQMTGRAGERDATRPIDAGLGGDHRCGLCHRQRVGRSRRG
jgi:3-oxoacyl-[acyl-carrier-protein] synthase II